MKRQSHQFQRNLRYLLVSVTAAILAIATVSCGEGADPTPESKQDLAAPDIQPTFVQGNPTCGGLGYGDFEFKIDPVQSGTYAIDGFNNITITVYSTTDGQVFDWSSELPIDAIVVKGGPNANLYDFTPDEYDAGTGYHSPTNSSNGRYYGLSHISFCYDYNLEVTKTADTSLDRTYNWEIEKSVMPASWSLFNGDSGTSEYEVSVMKTGYVDSNWKVTGDIQIQNPAPMSATITDVTDTVSGGVSATVDCGVTFPYTLGPGDSLTCSYMGMLPDGATRTNTATATTSGMVTGGSGEAAVDFASASVTPINAHIDVVDTNGDSWMATDDATWTYQRTFDCGGDEGSHPNTASIVQTGQSSSASVTVDCYELDVHKTAGPSILETFGWDIDKTITATDPPSTSSNGVPLMEVMLDEFGQGSGTVTYTVSLTKSSIFAYAAAGGITISNPNPDRAANLADVIDDISGFSPDPVPNCPSYVVPAGGQLTCSYGPVSLPDDTTRTNTATATQLNYAYAPDGTATQTGTTQYSGAAEIDFTFALVTTDFSLDTVDVFDTAFGLNSIGAFNQSGSTSYVITYDCGFQQGLNPNTASILQTGQSDDALVELRCYEPPDEDEGCTPGYWKNHLDSWMGTGWAPTDTVVSAFSEASAYVSSTDTLLMALSYPGGSSVAEKAQILLRAAVAALLNASSPGVDYAYSETEVINKVNAALKTGKPHKILNLANKLDMENNRGCPLN